MARDLNNKAIAITGGSSGIGAATAQACARAGMDVAILGRRTDRLQEVAQRIEAVGRRAVAVTGDVTKDDDVQRFIDQTWSAFGRLDAVYANAGYGMAVPVAQTPEGQHRAIFECNYWGTVRTYLAALPRLRATPGGLRHILVCCSVVSEVGPPMFGVYAATKAAQDSITQAMRAELAGEGVKVTSIHPAGTKSEFFDTAKDKSKDDPNRFNTPQMFMQSTEHVAGRIVKALRRPRAEVWPMPIARWGVGLATIFPGLTAWALARGVGSHRPPKPNG